MVVTSEPILVEPHPFMPTSPADVRRRMLTDMGIESIEELFADVPEKIRLDRQLKIPKSMSEMEVRRHVETLLSKNLSTRDMISFLGGGVWPHYVPAVVDEIVRRAEFLTSYTPYQPEISQGILQAMFEYQSMICELTGMDFTNSSMYDWSTALGEAARMATRATGRYEFLVPRYIHPERLATLRAYCEPAGIRLTMFKQDLRTGQAALEDLEEKVGGQTSGVYIEMPSYLGFIETRPERIAEIVHEHGGLFVVGVDPISLGILKPPGEYGADIVVGEGQPLGNHMNYGGPLLGILACNGEKLLRQMPGRMIGMATTKDGAQRAFTMVLQTREQHIRRERATSNICTNEALLALAAAVYLSLLGPRGLRELCIAILAKSHYAARRLNEVPGVRAPLFDSPYFKEFTVGFDGSPLKLPEINRKLLEYGIHGGKDLTGEFPELGQACLYCVTELHARDDIDSLVDALTRIMR